MQVCEGLSVLGPVPACAPQTAKQDQHWTLCRACSCHPQNDRQTIVLRGLNTKSRLRSGQTVRVATNTGQETTCHLRRTLRVYHSPNVAGLPTTTVRRRPGGQARLQHWSSARRRCGDSWTALRPSLRTSRQHSSTRCCRCGIARFCWPGLPHAVGWGAMLHAVL